MMQNSFILEQKQTMSQSQIQSLRILEMDAHELNDFLQNEYLENPLLDYQSGSGQPLKTEAVTSGGGMADSENDYAANTPAHDPDEWRRTIADQLNEKAYSKRQWRILQFLILSLDEDGYYRGDSSAIAKAAGVEEREVQGCLKVLKELEPAGIFSADLQECLLKQLEVSGVKDEILEEMISHHLEDVAAGYINRLSKTLKLSTVQVKKYIHMIQELKPKPFMECYSIEDNYVVPDVMLVETKEHGLDIVMNDKWMGTYSINEHYRKMMISCQDQDLKEYFKQAFEKSQFIVSCIEQRRSTMLKIISAITEIQSDYLKGSASLRPMTMQFVADTCTIHVSTVSRAIKNKYIQIPKHGTILLKDLFSTAVSVSEGEAEKNAEEIITELKKLIASENETKPYSDQKLAELLKDKGIQVARRTVTKYREKLGIPKTYERCIK